MEEYENKFEKLDSNIRFLYSQNVAVLANASVQVQDYLDAAVGFSIMLSLLTDDEDPDGDNISALLLTIRNNLEKCTGSIDEAQVAKIFTNLEDVPKAFDFQVESIRKQLMTLVQTT